MLLYVPQCNGKIFGKALSRLSGIMYLVAGASNKDITYMNNLNLRDLNLLEQLKSKQLRDYLNLLVSKRLNNIYNLAYLGNKWNTF